jgi:hypothetical protein
MKDLAYTIAWAVRVTSKWSMVIGMLLSATTVYGAMALAAKVLHHAKF